MFDDMEIDQTDSYTRLHADHIALMKEYGKLVGSHAAAVDLRKLAEKRIAELELELASVRARITELEA